MEETCFGSAAGYDGALPCSTMTDTENIRKGITLATPSKAAAIALTAGLFCAIMTSTPTWAWEHGKSEDSAWARMDQDGIQLSFQCRRGTGRVSMVLSDLSQGADLSAPLRSIDTSGALMLWIQLPDGRTSRDSFAGFNEQGSVVAEIPANHINWEFFANGQQLTLQDTGTRRELFKSQMKGTGAARLAFKERCGI